LHTDSITLEFYGQESDRPNCSMWSYRQWRKPGCCTCWLRCRVDRGCQRHASVKLSDNWNETNKTILKQFETVLFQFHFVVRTV